MTTPSLSRPWVLVRYGDAPPALACLTVEWRPGCFYGDLMVADTDRNGMLKWRKRYEQYLIDTSTILHVFPFPYAPSLHHVREARRALRRNPEVRHG